jgi:CDP-4-dehydro-6-deoxyglucose reductase
VPVRVEGVLAPPRELGAGVFGVDIRLQSDPGPVLPGQYVLLVHPDGTAIPFSLASPPRELPQLTLHYRSSAGSEDARRMDEILARPGPCTVELGHGDCGVCAPLARPLVMIAGGTGIAQARSIALELAEHAEQDLVLYWGARAAADLYARDEFDALAGRAPHFRWIAAVEDGPAGARLGTVAEVVAQDAAAGRIDLGTVDVLLCGGPPMVWGTVTALRPHGLTEARTRSDVFDYAPREDLWTD